MNNDQEEAEKLRNPFEPIQPKRPWPSPTPGVPFLERKENETKILNQILEKLAEIERRLEKIEKLLAKKFANLT